MFKKQKNENNKNLVVRQLKKKKRSNITMRKKLFEFQKTNLLGGGIPPGANLESECV